MHITSAHILPLHAVPGAVLLLGYWQTLRSFFVAKKWSKEPGGGTLAFALAGNSTASAAKRAGAPGSGVLVTSTSTPEAASDRPSWRDTLSV